MPPVGRRLVPALGDGVGAGRCGAVAAVRRRAHRGSHQAGLSRDPGAPRTHAADPGAGAGAGAVVDGSGDESTTGRQSACRRAHRLACKSRDGHASLRTRRRERRLLVPRIEIVARRSRRRRPCLRGAGRMRPAAAAREAFAAAIAFEAAGAAIDLRLRAGDERRQAIDAASVGNHRLRLRLRRLILRLRTMLAVAIMFARLLVALLLLARLIGLAFALMVALVGCRADCRAARTAAAAAGTKPGSWPKLREALALVLAVLATAFRSRCAAAAGSGGTAPGPRRSGGNNARHAGSSSRRRPDRRTSARRARAARIFRRHGRRCRGS